MSEIIIPDEWLIHDLIGENGKEAQAETLAFLEKVRVKCDRLAILEGSPFADKVYAVLMKDERIEVRSLSKYFRLQFMLNSKKCVVLPSARETDETLPHTIAPGDKYLLDTRATLREGTIVTTDSDLSDLQNVRMRDDFLREYD